MQKESNTNSKTTKQDDKKVITIIPITASLPIAKEPVPAGDKKPRFHLRIPHRGLDIL